MNSHQPLVTDGFNGEVDVVRVGGVFNSLTRMKDGTKRVDGTIRIGMIVHVSSRMLLPWDLVRHILIAALIAEDGPDQAVADKQ